MDVLNHRLEVRLTADDARRLDQIAARAGRDRSSVIRTILRGLDPQEVDTGIPQPRPAITEAQSRRRAVLA